MLRGFLFFSLIFAASCGAGNGDRVASGNDDILYYNTENQPVIEFVKTVYDFGNVIQGEVVGTTFIFIYLGYLSI